MIVFFLSSFIGDVLAILPALVWAMCFILMKKIIILEYNTIKCTRRVSFYGSIFMLLALPLFDYNFNLDKFTSMTNILNILYLGIGASATCFVTLKLGNWSYKI